MSHEVVKKASTSVQMTNKMSLFQRRAWNYLLSLAYNELLIKDTYIRNLTHLMGLLGVNRTHVLYVKDEIEKMNGIMVRWNVLCKDKDGKWISEEYNAIPLLAGTRINIKDDVIEYAYSPLIRKDLHNPRMYAKINLSLGKLFKSKYTAALYELFVDYLNEKLRHGQTPWIKIEAYRELMGVEQTEYKLFRELNRWVIKKPINEIEKVTSFLIEVKTKKVGRKIDSIKFVITLKSQTSIFDFCFEKEEPPSTLNDEIKQPNLTDNSLEEFIQSVAPYKINRKSAIFAINTHGLEAAIECRDYAIADIERRKSSNNPVRTPSAYLAGCLADGHGKTTDEERAEQARIEAEKKAKRQVDKNKKLLEQIRYEVDKNRKLELQKLVENLTDTQDVALREEFENEVKQNLYENMLPIFNSHGWRGRGVKIVYLHTFLPKKLLPAIEDDMREYAKSIGHDYDALV
ncbi:MAG: replication initiation protein [Candidatus Brocadiales bacterium]|nr:replication initiation protein [Candidatus Brocadiales bacterium]